MFSLRFIVCMHRFSVFSMNGVWLGISILPTGGKGGIESRWKSGKNGFINQGLLIGFGHDESYVGGAGFWLLM